MFLALSIITDIARERCVFGRRLGVILQGSRTINFPFFLEWLADLMSPDNILS
jgi:hypothetical protein